jgi:hypothetical protein
MGLGIKSIIEVGSEECNYEFVSSGFLFESITGNLSRWWSSLLENPRDDSIGSSTSGVFSMFSVFEPFESWESLDTEFFCKLLLLSGVNLSNEEWWIIFGKSFSSLFVVWSKLFAVTTPWCIEFNKKVLVLLNFLMEVIVSKYENSVIGFNSRYKADCEECN